MGDLQDIKAILETSLASINKTFDLHQNLIQDLQRENQELKKKLLAGSNDFDGSASSPINKSSNSGIISDSLTQEVINKVKRNKKRMIKNKILETIKFRPNLAVPDLKEIIVDIQKYCSKASFYRYMEELKNQDYILINEENVLRIKPLMEAV